MKLHPFLSPWAMLLAGLACSIGWGIRGNYGHEYGAMFPGAITALAVCIASQRTDWRRRFLFFAFFGAVGWGFGGSISYMQVISYTHSGHAETQQFGFWGLILIGFLWAALGVLGTSLVCELDDRRLTDLCLSAFVVFATWWVLDAWPLVSGFLRPHLGALLPEGQLPSGASRRNMSRHEHPLYWFDSDWLAAVSALAAMLALDLFQRRFRNLNHLLFAAGIGAAIGFGIHHGLRLAGATDTLANYLIRPLGDVERFAADRLISNWPDAFLTRMHHAGWIIGMCAGIGWHFLRLGEFQRMAGLPTAMAVGWLASFLLFPVLLDIRMTPPRGDNWAGILGAYWGAVVYFVKAGDYRIVGASMLGGMVGGMAFSGTAWIKLLMISLGNPKLVKDPEIVKAWAHWQSANWHSFLEQTYGFFNGLAVLIGVAPLVGRSPRRDDGPYSKPATFFAATFVLLFLTHVNMIKNVADWTRPLAQNASPMPKSMKAPLLDTVELTAAGWFDLLFAIAALCYITLLLAHMRRPLALIPESGLGRGQWLFLAITWIFVVGNFTKALAGYSQGRLLTEGTITVNAVLATVIALLAFHCCQEESGNVPIRGFTLGLAFLVGIVLLLTIAVPPAAYRHIRSIYGASHAGHAGQDFRFGPNASWRERPLLRGTEHR